MRMKKRNLIPRGPYCYDENGVCPYWSCDTSRPSQENGYCAYLETGDWEDEGCSLLWDQVKECGENKDTDRDDTESEEPMDVVKFEEVKCDCRVEFTDGKGRIVEFYPPPQPLPNPRLKAEELDEFMEDLHIIQNAAYNHANADDLYDDGHDEFVDVLVSHYDEMRRALELLLADGTVTPAQVAEAFKMSQLLD